MTERLVTLVHPNRQHRKAIRRSAGYCVAFLAALLTSRGAAGEEPAAETVQTIDCAGDARALWDAEPVVQRRDGNEIHQYWILADRPDLWAAAVPVFEPLAHYREKVREVVPDVSPLGLIRTLRERFPWLERDYPAEGRINRLVEAGVGTHRPMNCLETQVLAYQAARFPLYEQPSEIVALFVKRAQDSGDLIKVYVAADDDAIPPKPSPAVTAIEADVAAGWCFYGVFHNHTFDHSEDHGLLPVAAPSSNDLQLSAALVERLGLEHIFVADGFSTLELDAEEIGRLQRAAAATE
jgi:hypothetical protein